MDVSLVLTHRCNLDCGYCYAGEHYRKDMDDATLARAVDLLYSDGADTAQLSFFGGEPFLAFDAMRRATALAEARSAALRRTLIVQCTTNGSTLRDEHVAWVKARGVRATVSIDGVREAHDLNRPCAGGGSSFDQVRAGLRKLVAAGCQPDAMMVISPQTVPHVYSSVSYLWSEGVRKVRANLQLEAPWTAADRDELREQLLSVGWEQLARRTRGESASFEPFEKGMRRGTAFASAGAPRGQVVVGATGYLYPCAPMVGEDRDDGPEAALRLGHLDDGPARIQQRIACDGAGCSDGRGCACAAYLETGDRRTAGPNGRWYAAVCAELGGAIAAALAAHHYPPRPRDEERGRRPFLIGMTAAIGGLAVGIPALLNAGLFSGEDVGLPQAVPAGGMELAPPPEPPPPEPPPPGQMLAPPEPPPPPPPEHVDGNMVPEPEIRVRGEMKAPDPEPAEHVEGDMM
jgi:uncharacterized protein